MNNDIERVLYSTEEINAAEDRLAKQINADYADKKPLVVSVLTGAAPFSVDMFKKMTCYAQLDFLLTFPAITAAPSRLGRSN